MGQGPAWYGASMAESEQLNLHIELPKQLQGQFDRLERRLFRVETGALVAGCVAGLAGGYLLVFGSDRVWDSPVWMRGIAFAGGVAVAGWCGARWLRKWVLKRRTRKELAAIVQRRFQRLGDRLLGIVELSSEEKHQLGFSPELYRAAIRQVADESAQFNFEEAVSRRGLNTALRAALVAGGLAVVSFLIFPKAGVNAAKRVAAPWADVRRFTLVRMEGLPKELLVAHGEPFQISGEAAYESFWKPKSVGAKFGKYGAAAGSVEGQKFSLSIPAQLEESWLTLKLGDASARVRVRPLLRPSLKSLEATVELPPYLKLPARDLSAQAGSISVVEGSKATVRGQVSRPLAKAEAVGSDGSELPVKAEADRFVTGPLEADRIAMAEFRWEDQFGFTNQAPWKLAIQTMKDAAPVPDLPELSREVSILENEVVMIQVRARDDFGVRKVGLNWDLGINAATNQPYEFSLEAEKPNNEQFEQTFTFTPMMLQAAPDTTVAVRGYAIDYFPDREPAETPSYRIHILGNEQHAEMVRQRLESIMARLEEVSRLEEKIAAATAELKANEKISEEELARKAGELKEEQLQNAAALKDMSDEGLKNLREALKNPAFSEKVLTEWSKTMNAMQNLSQKPMKEAAKSLQQAAASSKSKDQKENLAEAEEKEKDVLQELQEMQKRVNKGLDDLQALTLAQRLRKLGTEQQEVKGELEKSVQETIGMLPEELGERFRKANAFLAEQQVDSRDRSKDLQGEISRFFERTRKPNYGMVSKQMAESGAAEELDRIRTLIEGNISMQAMDTLSLWATRFEGWADLLEPPKEKGGSQSGGQAGEPGEPDGAIKQLMALLRLREGQFNVRERTRMLNEDRRDEKFYTESAAKLKGAEAQLVETLDQVQNENDDPEMEPALRESSRAMQAVEELLAKPRTDQVTAQAQNRALERLSDAINLINEKQKKAPDSGPPGQSQGEEMAFLMEMMQQQNPKPGMQGGMKPGMNMNGGTTSQANNSVTGDSTGRADASRAAKKAGGSTASAPAEFREALENYYKALESGTQ